jgi:phosphoglycerate dehydrogenase-like enzyme
MTEDIHVIVAMDFSDALIERIRAVSPRLKVERHIPNVPERAWGEAEILYTGSTFPTPAQAPRLRWIQLHSAGVDHAVKEPIVQAEDVEITTASGIHATQMSEYCIGMILTFEYQIPRMLALKEKAEWPSTRAKLFAPYALRGQTLGIIGYGVIGRELARLADAFGMRVLASKRDAMRPELEDSYYEAGTGDPKGEIPARIYPPQALASMVKECDYVVVTLPTTSSTYHMVNAEVLRSMKKTAVIINVGRGSVIDEAELVSALAAERIRGAALDVFETEPLPSSSPLWNMENVVISPHVSGNSVRYHEKAAGLFVENLERYLSQRPLLNVLKREHGY